jgi:hypothetical protein
MNVLADVPVGQPVTQPALSIPENFNIFARQTNLFLELTIHRIFDRFIDLNSTLGKLPPALPFSPAQQDGPGIITEDDSHICPVAVGINIIHS